MALDVALDQLQVTAAPPRRAAPSARGRATPATTSAAVEAFTLWPGERAVVPTGVAVALPAGVAGLVVPRSGLAASHGLSVVNGPA